MEHELGGDRAVIIVSALVAPLLQCQKTTLVQRSAFAEKTCSSVHQKLLQLLNGEMSWKENSDCGHISAQNGEFIARYC